MKHWSETQKEAFKKRAAYLGYDENEACVALDVESLQDLPGSIGDALTRLKQIKETNQQRVTDHDLAPTLSESELAAAYDLEAIQREAHRARRFFAWAMPKGEPTDLSDIQIYAAIRYAELIGANPANEVHCWYDPKNKVFIIMPHYGFLVRKAREMDSRFMYWFEDIPADDMALGKGDTGVTAYGRTGAQQDLLVALLRADKKDLPFERIAHQTQTCAVGIVRKQEKTRQLPKGWTWKQRAETRALTNLIRRLIGTNPLKAQRLDYRPVGLPLLPNGSAEVYLDEQAVETLATGKELPEPIAEVPVTSGEDHEEMIDVTLSKSPESEPPDESTLKDQPKHKRRSWSGDTIKAIVTAKLAKNGEHAANRLELSDLDPSDPPDIAVGWTQQYQMGRDTGAGKTECAEVANNWLRAQMPAATQ
jgi:hypothetical protein